MVNKITKADRDDAHRICRSCLCKSSELISLAEPCDQINTIYHGLTDCHETIANLMMSCANIQVDVDDGLPQNICRECFIDISAAIVYRQKCEESNKELRQIFHDDFLNVSVKEGTKIESPTEIHGADDQHWFEIVDTEMPEEDEESSDDIGTIVLRSCVKSKKKVTDEWDEVAGGPVEKPTRKSKSKTTQKKSQSKTDETGSTEVKVEKKKTELVCDVCGASFPMISSLLRHQRCHASVREFQCDICKRTYKHKSNLGCHMRIHDGGVERNKHMCEECGNRYATKIRLTEHMREHTGERPFECDVCHKTFHRLTNLSGHKRIHAVVKPFPCAECDRGFSQKSALHVHVMMKHTGERPFKCTECSASSILPGMLKVHMRNHTGELAYLCMCGMRFQHRWEILKYRRKYDHFETEDTNQSE